SEEPPVDRDACRFDDVELEVAKAGGEEVADEQVHALEWRVLADSRESAVELPVRLEVGVHVVDAFVHPIDQLAERPNIGFSMVARGVPADQRLQRVSNLDAVGECCFAPVEAEDELTDIRPRGWAGDEDAAAWPRARDDETAHLHQADGLVDRCDRDSEPLTQLALGSESHPRCDRGRHDLALERPGESLRAGDTRVGQRSCVAVDCTRALESWLPTETLCHRRRPY